MEALRSILSPRHGAVAAFLSALSISLLLVSLSPKAARRDSRLEIAALRPAEEFVILRPRFRRIHPASLFRHPVRTQSLYSASLPNDPQEYLQPAPHVGNPGLFASDREPMRGEPYGTPEYKYADEPLPCPCTAGICLDLLMDEEYDQGPTPCTCNCNQPMAP
ncbi:hypothetical protein GUITHDRAFT_163857 [Guillardia theta CCMP2712]|uniref:Uncharacterized protein n=1 Tax=Guillardia theta (strain CCMP2712) TaxID=905079 RepID=L1J4M0_GUITC|nr:hypothetical protein GUITHDRAFT_163857 [Guillardia theta CCMP2712]EKX43478.1 hypothetical protein GUITHDRAFT_163857 [Guillardia theta CCMP2712]|eukprot:XP_005830458.1 hypothetical protein GUITHDRAFT_163857 [Guillardia theta CCMP2712]